jgi:hypothetical protein
MSEQQAAMVHIRTVAELNTAVDIGMVLDTHNLAASHRSGHV